MKVRVLYFAALREARGLSEEVVDTEARDGRTLYNDLSRSHSLTIGVDSIRFAVNDEFVSFDHRINNGDVVAFLPPVAGG